MKKAPTKQKYPKRNPPGGGGRGRGSFLSALLQCQVNRKITSLVAKLHKCSQWAPIPTKNRLEQGSLKTPAPAEGLGRWHGRILRVTICSYSSGRTPRHKLHMFFPPAGSMSKKASRLHAWRLALPYFISKTMEYDMQFALAAAKCKWYIF